MRALHTRIHAIASHHLDQVARELLKAGAAVDATEEDGFTALMLAAQDGHEQVSITHLPCVYKSHMHTRIHAFTSHHHEQVARELLKAKCNVDAAASNGVTALMLSAQSGHEQVRRTRMPSIERVVCTA